MLREKIDRFANGEFEYKLPTLQASADNIHISIDAGKQYEGSFSISNSINRNMKGFLYSSSRLLTFSDTTFIGLDNTITYKFDASYLNPSDIIKGNITIVSDCGELILPFVATILTPAIYTSIGKVRNLFEFTNLARMDWTEAKKVFRSEEFERIVLKKEKRYHVIYRNLVKSISTSQALEEFLIAVNKKSKINLEVDKTKLEYEILDEDFMDKLSLTKNNWGYAEIRVSTDAPFIKLEQKFLWADSFIGNSRNVSFVINAKELRPGNNYGIIWIKTVHQEIAVEVTCKKQKTISTEISDISEKSKDAFIKYARQINYNFSRSYLNFRIGYITIKEYVRDIETLLKRIKEPEDSIIIKLVRIHLAIILDNKRLATKLLDEISEQEASLRKKSVFEYCAYLYLLALYKKDDDTIHYVTETISRYYSSGNYDWRILWFLLFTDKRYDRNRSYKLADIKEQYKAGCNSPILYYEAVCVFNEEPYLLRELTDYEIQVMNFGIKSDSITMDLALQYTYLANRLKFYHPIVFRGLTKLYRTHKKEEILSAICSLLIKGYKRDNKYFKWYKLGVEAQLPITELYEYYMYSIDESYMEPFPSSLLLYFVYNSSLNDKKRACLYANIIINKKKNDQIYQTYYKKMEVFASKQLEANNISRNLAVIYNEFIGTPRFNSIVSEYLPDVMFTKEIYCDNTNMVSVIVVHKETEEEEKTPLNDGLACIDIYTKDASIFLVDSNGNRYVVSVDYTLTPLLMVEEIQGLGLDYEKHPKLLLHLFDHYQRNRVVNEDTISMRKLTLLISDLKESYYIDCLLTLVDYYYENYNTDFLEKYLMLLDISKISEKDRIKYLEYMVVRGYYSKALEALKYIGAKDISINRLLKLCSGWISNSGLDLKEELLVYLCHYIFSQGKYDLTILNYMVKYYVGSTVEMFSLWNAAVNFEVDPRDLEERLLTQILFTEVYHEDVFPLFFSYYNNVTKHQLVQGFLTYSSYKYLVHEMKVHDDLFPIIRRELNYEENNINLLAWLKFNADNINLSENDINFISYNIDSLERQGIILPFFQKYKNIIKLPEGIKDKCYVEYKANPKKQVFIHYRLLKDNLNSDFIIERMGDVLLGIHVKEFILFYNEDLEYYITEEDSEKVSTTKSNHLTYEGNNDLKEESKYNHINMMLMAMDMQDDTALLEMMESYVKSEYIIGECFEPLGE